VKAKLARFFRKSSGGHKLRFKSLIPHHRIKMAGAHILEENVEVKNARRKN